MPNQYHNVISKINLDESTKENLILQLEQNKTKKVKGVLFMKIKRAMIAIVSTLTILLGTGTAYAALGGTINGVPMLEWIGIKFSNQEGEYIQPIQNQVVENDVAKVALESAVCDDGFTILQFRVNLKDKIVQQYEDEINEGIYSPAISLFYNESAKIAGEGQSLPLGTDGNPIIGNPIIDGNSVDIRNEATEQTLKRISISEYLVYQVWFLDETILGDEETFEIELRDIAIKVLGRDGFKIDGSIQTTLSKTEAMEHSKVITPKEEMTVTRGKMKHTLEKVTVTPLQNIVEIKTVYEDVNRDDFKNTIRALVYEAYYDDIYSLSTKDIVTESRITYEDGSTEEHEVPDVFFENDIFDKETFEHAKYEITRKIAIDQSDKNEAFTLKVYEYDFRGEDERKEINGIQQYDINLVEQTIKSQDEVEENEQIENDATKVKEKIKTEKTGNILEADVTQMIVGVEGKGEIEIKNKEVIEQLVTTVNKNTQEFKNYAEIFGEDDGGASPTWIQIHLADGKFYFIAACDDYVKDTAGKYWNLIFVVDVKEPKEKSMQKVYIIETDLEKTLDELYEQERQTASQTQTPQVEEPSEDETEILSDVDYIEISIPEPGAESYVPKTATIRDEKEIKQLVQTINEHAKRYETFLEDVGAGDYFEGGATVMAYLKNGNQVSITALDHFDQDKNGEYYNVFNYCNYEWYGKILIDRNAYYKIDVDLQQQIKELYQRYEGE